MKSENNYSRGILMQGAFLIINKVSYFYKILLLSIFLSLITTISYSQQSDKQKNYNRNYFNIGIDGGLIYFDPKDINSLIDSWFNSVGSIDQEGVKTDIHIGYSISGFISFLPLKFIEIRPAFEYFEASKKFDLEDNKDLNIKIQSYSPGISANFVLGVLRIGGSYFKSYAMVDWNDKFIPFNDVWDGSCWGYNIFCGLNAKLSNHSGMSFNFIYNNVLIEELRNKYDQVIRINDESRNFNLDLTGFELNFGIYVTF